MSVDSIIRTEKLMQLEQEFVQAKNDLKPYTHMGAFKIMRHMKDYKNAFNHFRETELAIYRCLFDECGCHHIDDFVAYNDAFINPVISSVGRQVDESKVHRTGAKRALLTYIKIGYLKEYSITDDGEIYKK